MTLFKKHALLLVKFQSFPVLNKLKNSSLIAVLMMPLLSLSSSANDLASLNAEQNSQHNSQQSLVSSCNAFKSSANSAKAQACQYYIDGFLNGILNANNAGVAGMLEEKAKSATLVERAYTNRVGNNARPRTEPKTTNDACLSVDEYRKRITVNLSNNSLSSISSLKQLNARLVHILKDACSTDTSSK